MKTLITKSLQLIILLVAFSQLTTAQESQRIGGYILERIEVSSTLEDQVFAYLLLDNIVLEEELLSALKELNEREEDSIALFLQHYLIADQTYEAEYRAKFIQSYPLGQKLNQLNRMVFQSDFISLGPAFQSYLAMLAFDDDAALKKMIQIQDELDASYSEIWTMEMSEIYEFTPQRVEAAFKALDKDINEVFNLNYPAEYLSEYHQKKIMNLLINHRDIMSYYHLGTEKSPLLIVENEFLKPTPSVNLLGEPVEWVKENEVTEQMRYLNFETFQKEKTIVNVQFTMPFEGVKVEAVLKINPLHEWELISYELTER